MAKTAIANQALLTEPELRARLGELYASIDQFNRRWYFESHETLEDLWMVTPMPDRQLFQGIIQLAAAFVHFARGEYPGVLKLLDASIEKLREFAPERFGIDVTSLIDDASRVREEFASLGEQRFGAFDERRVPVLRVTATAP
jgi:predicted metal-dependent hydrolase